MRSGCEFLLQRFRGHCAASLDACHHPVVTSHLYCASTSGMQLCCTIPRRLVPTPRLRRAVLALSDVGHAVRDLHHDTVQGLSQADLATQTGPEYVTNNRKCLSIYERRHVFNDQTVICRSALLPDHYHVTTLKFYIFT